MASLQSRSLEFSRLYGRPATHTRRLQEGLYALLDEQEKCAFIEVLKAYGVRKDILELVNSLRKILNTPVKRQLFPLVRGVIRPSDTEAFDLLTRGRKKSPETFPRPFLYRPHAADIAVLRKHRSMTLNRYKDLSRKNSRRASSVVSDFADSANTPPGLPPNLDIHKVFIESRDENYAGFGFNIRGGWEYGLGVYVSNVDEGGPADLQGLQVGDLIVEANDISFTKISHGEAAGIIMAANRLELSVWRVGRIPDTHTVHEAYKWLDARGRPVSPPPDLVTARNALDDADIRSRSSLNLLKGNDERKVNMVVDKGYSLGLTIRGGRDYGLGIYISGVDPFSVAENAGLKVGDQILDVNGESMLGITHAEAVRTLSRCRHMVLTVKDVGRVPYAKTTIDRTGWVSRDTWEGVHSSNRHSRLSGRRTLSEPDLLNVGFSRGAGSQLMLSTMSRRSQHDILEEQARVLLNAEEQATLRYYMSEYSRCVIGVPGLVSALMELLNTGAKRTLLSEIRPLLRPSDLNLFDQKVHAQGEIGMHTRRETVRRQDSDSLSVISADSADAFLADLNKRTLFSTKIRPVMRPKLMNALTTDSHKISVYKPSLTKHKALSPSRAPSDTVSPSDNALSDTALSDIVAASESRETDHWDTITDISSQNGDVSSDEINPSLIRPSPFTRSPSVRRQKWYNSPTSQGENSFKIPRPFIRSPPVRRQKGHNRPVRMLSPVTTVMRVSAEVEVTASEPANAIHSSPTTKRTHLYTKAEVHGGSKGILKRWRRKFKVRDPRMRVRFPGHVPNHVITTNSDPEPPNTDEPSDDSGVEVGIPCPSHPKYPLASGHGHRLSKGLNRRVTISNPGHRELDNKGRQLADTQVMFASPEASITSAQMSRVSARTYEAKRREEGREKYGDIPLAIVYIYRCKPTLGLAIEGGANTRQPLPRVVTVQPGGSAFESGGLRVGHVILEVNRVPLAGKSHNEAAKLIAETFRNKEEERMELLVTESSDSVMDELGSRLSELSVEQ